MEQAHDATMPRDDLTGTRVGRYEVRSRLGAGGMGEVYLAEDVRLGRKVALKRLPPAIRNDPKSRQRFLREARRASELNHPHIASLYDVLEEQGEPFLVMEYVEGSTLRQRLQEPVSLREFLILAVQCAEALAAAHQREIIHGDLKPENIMLTSAGQVKVLDFGVAKRLDEPSQQTSPGASTVSPASWSGTLPYTAPEVLTGGEPDVRSDIFALGIVFYELLCGQHPFLGGSLLATGSRILKEQPTPVRQRNPAIPPEVSDAVSRMLAKDPARRYAKAPDLLKDLRHLRNQLLEPSARPSWWRRRPVIVASAAALALAAVVAIPGVRQAISRWVQGARGPATGPFASHGYILVGDFENHTREPAFDNTLSELVTTALEQSRYVNVYPSDEVSQALQRMERPVNSRIDADTGREICQRENLQALVLGSIAQIDDSHLLTLRAETPRGQVLYAGEQVVSSRSAVLPALDRLVTGLRGRLGESLQAIQQNSEPLEQVTSSSLEAIRDFSLGKRQLYAGRIDDAERLMKQAVAADPNFAMAYEYLAVISLHQARQAEAGRYFQKALQLSNHITERENRKILGDYHLFVTGDVTQAIDDYKALLEAYPDDYAGHTNLAVAYKRERRFNEAAREAALVLERLESPDIRDRLAFYKYLAGRTAEAEQIEQQNLYGDPQGSLFELGLFGLAAGRTDDAKAYFARVISLNGAGAARGHAGTADAYWSGGQYSAAARELEAARRVAQDSQDTDAEARVRLGLARLLIESHRSRSADVELRKATELTGEPELLALGATLAAEAGDLTLARSLERQITAAESSLSTTPSVRCAILLAEGHPQAAAAIFNTPGSSEGRTINLEWQARAYAQANRAKDAAAAYRLILERQAERAINEVDSPALHRVVEAYYWLGVIEQRLGESDQARLHLGQFLNFFYAADPQAPFLKDAQVRLRELEASGTSDHHVARVGTTNVATRVIPPAFLPSETRWSSASGRLLFLREAPVLPRLSSGNSRHFAGRAPKPAA